MRIGVVISRVSSLYRLDLKSLHDGSSANATPVFMHPLCILYADNAQSDAAKSLSKIHQFLVFYPNTPNHTTSSLVQTLALNAASSIPQPYSSHPPQSAPSPDISPPESPHPHPKSAQ